MVQERTEGTLILDGMIEGRLPDDADARDRLERWVQRASQSHLLFHLEADGGSFSLLADNQPVRAALVGSDRSGRITDLLEELAEELGPSARLFSTLRSVEYKREQELQSLYAYGPDGAVAVRQRNVEAKTAPPPPPLSRREKIRMGAYSVVVVLALFGISSLFVNWRGLFGAAWSQVAGFDAQKIVVEAPAFADHFTVEKKQVQSGGPTGQVLVITLKRTAAATQPATRPVTTPIEQAAQLAWATGYIHVESFTEKGEYFESRELRIRNLQSEAEITVALPLSKEPRTSRLVLTP